MKSELTNIISGNKVSGVGRRRERTPAVSDSDIAKVGEVLPTTFGYTSDSYVARGWNLPISVVFRANGISVQSVDDLYNALAESSKQVRSKVNADIQVWNKRCAGRLELVENERRITWALEFLSRSSLTEFLDYGGRGEIMPVEDLLANVECVVQKRDGLLLGFRKGCPAIYTLEGVFVKALWWGDIVEYYTAYANNIQCDPLNPILGYSFSVMYTLLTGFFGKTMNHLTTSQRARLSRKFARLTGQMTSDATGNHELARAILYDMDEYLFDFDIDYLRTIMEQAITMNKYLKLEDDTQRNANISIHDLRRILFSLSPHFMQQYSNKNYVKDGVYDTLNMGEFENPYIMGEGHSSYEDTNALFTRANRVHTYRGILLNFNGMIPSNGDTWASYYALIERVASSLYVDDGINYHPTVYVVWNMASARQYSTSMPMYCNEYTQLAVGSPLFLFEFSQGVRNAELVPVFHASFFETILQTQLDVFMEIVSFCNNAQRTFELDELVMMDVIYPMTSSPHALYVYDWVSRATTKRFDVVTEPIRLNYGDDDNIGYRPRGQVYDRPEYGDQVQEFRDKFCDFVSLESVVVAVRNLTISPKERAQLVREYRDYLDSPQDSGSVLSSEESYSSDT